MPSSRRPVSSIALLTGVLALLCIPLSGLPSTAASGVEAAPTLARPTYGSLVEYDWVAPLDLASGRERVGVGMPGPRKVMVQSGSDAGGLTGFFWGEPRVLYRAPAHVTCDAIEGREAGPYDRQATVPGGVALLVECSRPHASGPASPRNVAMVEHEGFPWAGTRVDRAGPPAISPSAQYAAWLTGRTGEYIEWSTTSGFSAPARTTYRFGSGGETITVDNTGTVTVLGPEKSGKQCVIGAHSRDLAGNVGHSVVTGIDPGCTKGRLENVDALTVTGGASPASEYTISRASATSPWALTRIPAAATPGLVIYDGSPRRVIRNHYLANDFYRKLVLSVASPDRRRIFVQRYDKTTQTWTAQAQVYDAGRRCRDAGFQPTDSRDIFVLELVCGRDRRLLAATDYGATWAAAGIGERPWTIGGFDVAVPGKHSTVILGLAEPVRVPVTTGGRCDVVYPLGGQDLLRLHGRRAWPNRLQSYAPGRGWATIAKVRMPRTDRCRSVTVDNTLNPSVVHLVGSRSEVLVDFRWNVFKRQWEVKPVHRAPVSTR